MRRSWRLAAVSVLALAAVLASPPIGAQRASDDDLRRQMIEDSIRAYSGNCPCPYNLARNGSRCGNRSAYSRPGGASPLCYPEDISQAMLDEYKRRKGIK